MRKVKESFKALKDDMATVLQKPSLILSIIVIGFFMVWFASEQVRSILRFLIHLEVTDERQALTFYNRYLFFGMSSLSLLWVDLTLINLGYHRLRMGYRAIRHYWHRMHDLLLMSKKDDRPSNGTSKRRYALRSYSRRDS